MDNTLYLIDTYSIIFRAYYGIQRLSRRDGFATNAIFGSVKSLLKILVDFNPKYICAVFDSVGKTFRKEADGSYKANRAVAPEDLVAQFPVIEEFIGTMGFPRLRIEGLEADDVIATLAVKFRDEFGRIVIFTGDKDLFQLIDEKVEIFDPKLEKWFDRNGTFEKFGVYPSQIKDFLALVGDSSDNIRGAPGIGEKTAVKLLGEYGSLEALYGTIGNLPERIRRSLEEFSGYRKNTEMLLTLLVKEDAEVSRDDLILHITDRAKLGELIGQYEFQSLLKDFEIEKKEKYLSLCTQEDLKDSGILFIDCPDEKELFIIDEGICRFIKMDIGEFPEEYLKKRLVSPSVKNVLKAFLKAGKGTFGKFFDIFISAHILHDSARVIDLDDLINIYPVTERFASRAGLEAYDFDRFNMLFHAANCYFGIMDTEGFKENYLPVCEKLEFPLIPVLCEMEMNGIKIDRVIFEDIKSEYRKIANALEKEILEGCGESFNLESPKQLAGILYSRLNYPVVKKTKTGPSTDSDALEKILSREEDAKRRKVIQDILDYREVRKILSTYLEGFDRHIKNGRVHSTFLQTSTSTGRLSSENPNMQNIPIKTEKGALLRKFFVPSSEGLLMLSIDYSQIELRILAEFSGDEAMNASFATGTDIHAQTASRILGISLDEVGKRERMIGKTINFGIIYGMGPFHLSDSIGISMNEAKRFIESYYREFKGVKAYQDALISEALKTGYVETLFKRKRYIAELLSPSERMKNAGIRAAVNAPIQGTASEIIKLAMIEIFRQELPVKMLLQIHDELIFEGPAREMPSAAEKIRGIMEGVVRFKVPLKAEYKVGSNWYDIH